MRSMRILAWPAAAARRRVARTSLLGSVSIGILTGAVLTVALAFATGVALDANPDSDALAPIDVLKIALAVVVGVGGAVALVVALVVAYRRQRDVEKGRFVERFGAAAAELGDPDVAVRIAGVYAMAATADDSRDLARRQQCIDVLCGYLRLPYEPEHGSSHRTELVTTTTRQAPAPITSIEEQARHQLRQDDREVRQTIVRIIASHLQPRAENNWSRHDYDFTGVLFEDARFLGAVFNGKNVSFDRATFSGASTNFGGARFSGVSASFEGAMFSSASTSFEGAMFGSASTSFDEAMFGSASTSFHGAQFRGADTSFEGAQFTGERTCFDRAAFSSGRTSFDRAAFNGGRTTVDRATFNGRRPSFDSAHEWTNVSVDGDGFAERNA
jgi:hypothetical protein